MKTNHSLLVVLTAISSCILLAACTSSAVLTAKESKFREMYPSIPMDGLLHLTVIDDPLMEGKSVEIMNVSHHIIRIEGWGAHKLYSYDEAKEEWIPIKETMNYMNDREVWLYPTNNIKEDQHDAMITGILPDLPADEKVTVRMVIVGEIVEGNLPTGRHLGAYIDIPFAPGDATKE